MKKISFKWFYLMFCLISFVSPFIYIKGVFNPNVASYKMNFIEYLSFCISITGTIFFVTAIVARIKSITKKINVIVAATAILTVVLVALNVYSNIFGIGFSVNHLTSFRNPGEEAFILNYVKFAGKLLGNTSSLAHFALFLIQFILSFFVKKDTILLNSPEKKLIKYFPVKLRSILLIELVLLLVPLLITAITFHNSPYQANVQKMSVSGIYNYLIYDPLERLYVQNKPLSSSEENEVEAYLLSMESKNKTTEYSGLLNGKNLIYLQLEQMNNLLIDLVVDGIEITPNLNRLAHEYTYFSNFYSPSGIGNTADTEFSSVTGLYPSGNNITFFDYPKVNYETIIKDFNKSGYDTFSAHVNVGEFYDRSELHKSLLGFDTHYDKKYFESQDNHIINSWISDRDFLLKSSALINDSYNDNPYVAYLIASTSHMPYINDSTIIKHNFKSVTSYLSNYLNYAIYVDGAIGEFFDSFDEDFLDNTCVVIYGDHTPSLFKSDVNSLYKTNIDDILYRMKMQNQLCLFVSSSLKSQTDQSVHSNIDLYFTLKNLYGLESKYEFGADMFDTIPTHTYSPRTYDCIYDDFTINMSNEKMYGSNISKSLKQTLIENFRGEKRMNDLLLRSRKFQ